MTVNQVNIETNTSVCGASTTPIFSVTHLDLTLVKGRDRTPILEDVSFDV